MEVTWKQRWNIFTILISSQPTHENDQGARYWGKNGRAGEEAGGDSETPQQSQVAKKGFAMYGN